MAKNYYFSKHRMTLVPFNRFDGVALLLIFGLIALIALGAKQMVIPYHIGQAIPISLAPTSLPIYALRTVLRMFFALLLSLLITFTIGTLAAKNRHAERFIIPLVDILQSIPVLGFLSITIVGFIHLFRGSLLGPECAAIFAIFTAQVWNMILSFYQSLKTIPHDLDEACQVFRLNAWQKFWRLEVPFAMPGLLWNTMMSLSASWFFVVASEAIDVADYHINLPGIGSYIGEAILQADKTAIIYAIIAMFIVILLYDQLIFRPLIVWAEKFKLTVTDDIGTTSTPLITRLLQRTSLIKYITQGFDIVSDYLVNYSFPQKNKPEFYSKKSQTVRYIFISIWYLFTTFIIIGAIWTLYHFITQAVPVKEIFYAGFLGLLTALRVFAVVLISSIIWLPLGVWLGLRPQIGAIAQPIMQFMAAFPAYLLFPVVNFFIVTFNLNVQIWVIALMLLGTQWYIAFNVIAGSAAIPKELHLVASNFGLRGWMRWRKLILPAIFPYYITGCITAVGGAWNVSIVAEIITWGDSTLQANGIGAYVTHYTQLGNFPKVALGIAIMCIYVLFFNRVIWRPLYALAEKRFHLDID